MKHGLRPTKKQKIIINDAGLNPNNWLVTKNLVKAIHIVHRDTGNERIIEIA